MAVSSSKPQQNSGIKQFFARGEPWIWITGAALSSILLMAFFLVYIVASNGLGVFWPSPLGQFHMEDGSVHLGEITQEKITEDRHEIQLKIGNRDLYRLDFKWIDAKKVREVTFPKEAVTIEREEYGNFYGYIAGDHQELAERYQKALALKERYQSVRHEITATTGSIAGREGKLKRDAYYDEDGRRLSPEELEADPQIKKYRQIFNGQMRQARDLEKELRNYTFTFHDAAGKSKEMELSHLVRYFHPNHMSFSDKVAHYFIKVGELFTEKPRESNTEGGLFPAIFGTVMMVVLMSLLSFPLGVVAGIYLREYAKEGVLVRCIRIAVNNLAGIPAIVYGIFGLGFFIYGIGSTIDQLFYAERLPEPTFGTGGILWASLTLGILTIPVVIVATEEALGSIPGAIRQNSYALGATQFQTIMRVLLPAASPGIMTGFILAMTRAAGEVAPLMVTGVVKLAPNLPFDGNAPFFHLERKFMHLGFHIYDISAQSPNVEAAKPMVYVTTLLLLGIVLGLCSVAILLRTRMHKKFSSRSF